MRVKVEFAAPKHGTELSDFRGITPFIDGKFDSEWKVFMEREADEPRGIEFGDLPIGNMFVGNIIEAGTDVTDYAVGDRVCSYGPIEKRRDIAGRHDADYCLDPAACDVGLEIKREMFIYTEIKWDLVYCHWSSMGKTAEGR